LIVRGATIVVNRDAQKTKGEKKMSLESWKKEFYPVPADQVKGMVNALKHSIKKWTGFRPENLAKHDLSTQTALIKDPTDPNFFKDMGKSCALCVLYHDKKGSYDHSCAKCPIVKTRESRCDVAVESEQGGSPYRNFMLLGNPEPMLELLEQTLKNARAKNRIKRDRKKMGL
jgi:hypothetical protein